MASHSSALKAHRHSLRRREVNRANLSRLRSQIRTLRETVAGGDAAKAQQLLTGTLSLIDRSIQKGVLHENAASRHKSRLTRLVAGLSKGAAKA
jgi:small subunit ribosomal protein S20